MTLYKVVRVIRPPLSKPIMSVVWLTSDDLNWYDDDASESGRRIVAGLPGWYINYSIPDEADYKGRE